MKKKIVAVVLVIAVFASLAVAEVLVLRARGNAEMTHVDEGGRIVISGIDVSGGVRFDGNSGYGRAEPVALTKGSELFNVDFSGLYFNETYDLVLNIRSKDDAHEYLYGGYKTHGNREVYYVWPCGTCERLDKHGDPVEEREITQGARMWPGLYFPISVIHGTFIDSSGEDGTTTACIPFAEPGTYRMTLYCFEYLPEEEQIADKVGDRYEEVSFIVTIEPQRADVEVLDVYTAFRDDGELRWYGLVFRGDEGIEVIDERCSDTDNEVNSSKLFSSLPSTSAFQTDTYPHPAHVYQSPKTDIIQTFSRSNGDTFDVTVTFGQDPLDPEI